MMGQPCNEYQFVHMARAAVPQYALFRPHIE